MSETAVRERGAPVVIRMHVADNVAIVGNDGGLPAGTLLQDGVTLREHVPQGHKVALVDFAKGALEFRIRLGPDGKIEGASTSPAN